MLWSRHEAAGLLEAGWGRVGKGGERLAPNRRRRWCCTARCLYTLHCILWRMSGRCETYMRKRLKMHVLLVEYFFGFCVVPGTFECGVSTLRKKSFTEISFEIYRSKASSLFDSLNLTHAVTISL